MFVRHDTHWSPEGVKAAGEVLAQHLRPLLAFTQPERFQSVAQSARLPGDLLSMLGLPGDWRGNPPETHEFHRVMDGPRPAAAGDEAPVLLLGDSFSMVYDSAGLASRIMNDLGTGVQVLAEPGGAVHVVREMLRQRPATLAHKKVVIWAFASRRPARRLPADVAARGPAAAFISDALSWLSVRPTDRSSCGPSPGRLKYG